MWSTQVVSCCWQINILCHLKSSSYSWWCWITCKLFLTFLGIRLRDYCNTFLSASPQTCIVNNQLCTSNFHIFDLVSEEEVRNVIKSSSITSCSLDPLPLKLFKTCLPTLLPVLTEVVNTSLSLGIFPSTLKHACITPLLKKPSLDVEELSNYRPISNLPFIGKVIERVASSQLQSYLSSNGLFAPRQSAYRPNHSVESALLSVHNDINIALDNRNEVLMVLLDFSAAFDTINHKQLLNRLSSRYGISGMAQEWFASYLNDRFQSVVVKDVLSNPAPFNKGRWLVLSCLFVVRPHYLI